MAQLRDFYKKEVIPSLTQQFGYDNPMRVPKVTKVVLNMGLGEAVTDKKVLEAATGDLTMIAGQKVVVTMARKSIAGFKIREGWPVGCKVTLRGERMYEFLERLVSIAIPRIRDFRGLSPKSFDGRGNFAMGVTEQIIFPEVDYDKIDALRGLDIAITTSAESDDEGRALLTALRFPFRKPALEADEAPVVQAAAAEEVADADEAPVVEEAAAEQAPVVEEAAEAAPKQTSKAASKQTSKAKVKAKATPEIEATSTGEATETEENTAAAAEETEAVVDSDAAADEKATVADDKAPAADEKQES
jgi:large subunit ribosomal protein L5